MPPRNKDLALARKENEHTHVWRDRALTDLAEARGEMRRQHAEHEAHLEQHGALRAAGAFKADAPWPPPRPGLEPAATMLAAAPATTLAMMTPAATPAATPAVPTAPTLTVPPAATPTPAAIAVAADDPARRETASYADRFQRPALLDFQPSGIRLELEQSAGDAADHANFEFDQALIPLPCRCLYPPM